MTKKKIFILIFTIVFSFVLNLYGEELKIFNVVASSIEKNDMDLRAENAIDGNEYTRWASDRSNSQWISFEFEKKESFNLITIIWETAYAEVYEIQTSNNKKKWNTIYKIENGDGGKNILFVEKQKAKYIRLCCIKRGTQWGYSIFEFKVEKKDVSEIKSTASLHNPDKLFIKEVEASSPRNKVETRKAADGDFNTRWSSYPTDSEWIMFTLKEKKVIDKIDIYWETAYGETYQIQVSKNRRDWFVAYNAIKHKGGKEVITFAPVSAKYIRIFGVSRGTQWGYSIFECEIYASTKKPTPITELPKPESIKYNKTDISPTAYFYHSAAKYAQEYYPIWFYKRQAYWTTVGVPYSRQEALLSEDGRIDIYTGGFSLMPYLYVNDEIVTAQDVDSLKQNLEDGYLPIPSVTWEYKEIDFNQRLFAYGSHKQSYICILYTLKNNTKKPIKGKLFLTIQPFQVNPPWMSGGFAKISQIEKHGNTVDVNKHSRIIALNEPDDFGAIKYEDGDIIDKIRLGKVPESQKVKDRDNLASGAFEYRFELQGDSEKNYIFIIPVARYPEIPEIKSLEEVLANLKEVKKTWEKDLNKIEIKIPDQYLVDVFRSNLAYIMLNYDDSAFIPGPRNYERSWTRDGSGMAAAVLRCGHYDMVKKYIRWLISYQRSSGEIPPILDTDGNPRGEKEYDNQGEFLFTACEYYRFTKDKGFLKEIFPALIKAVRFIETLRNQRTTSEYINTGFYGILPTSISHEGFPDPGAHSYYDDWWALKGLKDVQYLAAELGRKKEVVWVKNLENQLQWHCVPVLPLPIPSLLEQDSRSSGHGR